jgi:hypothetical protein
MKRINEWLICVMYIERKWKYINNNNNNNNNNIM